MKKPARMNLIVVLLLFSPLIAIAQNPIDCDLLRDKIVELEKLENASTSPSIQRVYKESRLKLYTQFGECLQRDISTLTDIQRAVAGTDAAPAVEEKLRTLRTEKANNDSGLARLKATLNAPTGAAMTEPAPSASDGNGPREAGAAVIQPSTSTSPAIGAPGPQVTFNCAPGIVYDQAPALLTDIVGRDVSDAVDRDNPNRAIASAQKMILYTIIDAASSTSSELLRGLEAYQYLGETGRTDKQLGGSASSEGAVSAIEKPGFARLLGFAVEHGAINKKTNGTNLTLSTSLYSLYTLNNPDTAETYARAGILNRVGISASFAVDNQTNDLANARRNNLSEWSVKARLFGDRSTRSPRFKKFWDDEIRPIINRRLQAIGGAIEGLSRQDRIPGFSQFREDVELCLLDQVKKRMSDADYKAANPVDRKKILGDLMLGYLNANVFARVKDGRLVLTPEAITLIETQYVPNLKTALDDLKSARGELVKRLDDLRKGPLGTFAYANHRIPTGSDYSEAKFLFEQDKSFLRPLKLTGNFGLSFYNKPDPSLKQQKLRDISAALSFDGSSKSPFTEAENQSKITYSFVGRYERMFENRRSPKLTPDIGTFQFVMEIPFIKGLSLPLSATYANGTEDEKKNHFRFNFGMRLDTDKLFELLKAASSH
jgi:hypothetical protein